MASTYTTGPAPAETGNGPRNFDRLAGAILPTNNPFPHRAQLLTAIPVGRQWRVKVVAPDGETFALPKTFSSRVEALGAGVLLSALSGGRVVP